MKRLYLFLLTCNFLTPMFAQRYGMEWINYGQKYYKIPLLTEGIYRLDSITLARGFDLSLTDPRTIQLFLKGQEVRLYISGENDGRINSGDYVEFYANPLPGELDSLIYRKDIRYLPNPYRPLFNDTIYGFLTLKPSGPVLRYALDQDTTSAGAWAASYFYTEKVATNFNGNGAISFNGYNTDDLFDESVSDPNYTQAEGRGSFLGKGATAGTNFNLQLANVNPTLPVKVRYVLSGFSRQANFYPDHQIRLLYAGAGNAPVTLLDTSIYGYAPVMKEYILPAGQLFSSGNFSVQSVAVPNYTFSNQTMLHYIRAEVPQTLNLNGQASYRIKAISNAGAAKSFYNFSNLFNPTTLPPLLYDLRNGKKLKTVLNGSLIRAVITTSGNDAWTFLCAEQAVTNITTLQPVNGNGRFEKFKTNTSRRPYVIIYHPDLMSSVQQYASYRSSIAGGNYEVLLANINHLYEQFGYGVNKHPLAIRQFARFLKDSLGRAPAGLFLIGKGIKQIDLNAAKQSQNLIPTMGVPSSDHLLTTALSTTDYFYPQIPIGRLAALTNQEVLDYLEKVQDHESSGKAEWKKKVLHFVGGDDENLNERLKVFMDAYAETISDTVFGAQVTTFIKNTTAPVQTQISDSIRRAIDNGASILNFFGHGSEQGFDQAIDDPIQYNNAGRYPFIIANSCYSGNIFVFNSKSVSERFVTIKKRGSIGFIATSSYGFDLGLDHFTRGLYRAISGSHYGQTIGEVVQEACRLNSLAGDRLTPLVGLEMCLHADPAIVISVGAQPDYQLKNNQISFDLKKYTDSIAVIIAIRNPGKAIHDSLSVRITRYFPNNDSLSLRKKIKATLYLDTLRVNLFLDFDRGIGLNRFSVMLDDQRRIAESDETNNTTLGSVNLFVPGGDILPVIPPRFALLPKSDKITLKASTSDPFAPLTSYIFQLDTSDLFHAPLSQTVITTKGGVAEWTTSLTLKDSTVYFWRVSRDSLSPEKTFAWKSSSFQTMSDKSGWAQSHFHQFAGNGFQFVRYQKKERRFIFQNTKYSVSTRVGVWPNIALEYINSYYNNLILDQWSPMFNGWNLAVFDSASGKPWRALQTNNPFNNAGQYNNCSSGDRWVYSFGTIGDCNDTSLVNSWKKKLENFINLIPKNNYVLGYSTPYQSPYANYTSYSNGLYTAFESMGVSKMRTTADSLPYTFFGKKGSSPGQAQEVIGANKRSIIYLVDTITTAWRNGFVASPRIGPSAKWTSLHWQVKSLDNKPGDTTILKIVGIRYDGKIDTLHSLSQESTDLETLGQIVDAERYPYLQLVAMMKDNRFKTCPQLKYWRVYFEEAPECAINPLKGFAALKDSLQEGDLVRFKVPIENIGNRDFRDSLVCSYWLEDNQRNRTNLPDRYIRLPLKKGDVYMDTLQVSSYELPGKNQLWMQVNASGHKRYQYEQEFFNNIAKFDFKVNKDQTNPLLDVTFDGIRILNGDLVSAKPRILIALKDENKFLVLNDTSNFNVWLTAPGQVQKERLYFANVLEFTPAQLPKNSAIIRYQPAFQKDGIYQLTVQARDRSSNLAGSNAYSVQFEINTHPGMTQVMNYPNPFTTSTRFVFTLTGSEVPEVFTIQIMTISGKMVREITRSELGGLHIGRNITDYAWDGRDYYGDRLANGVYLYRVITRLNGDKMDLNSSGADSYFTKEFGKMVLIR